MASIYTCQTCRRRFTIYRDGDYLCDCGKVFSYPPVLSTEKACFVSLDQMRREQERSRRVAPRGSSQGREQGFAGVLIRALSTTLF